MSGSGVNISVGIDWTIPIRVEKSSWASRIIIMIVALVSIMAKMIVDQALRSTPGKLMWWWEGTSTTMTALLALAMSTTMERRWSRMVAWSTEGSMNRRRREDEGCEVWWSDSMPTINLLAKHDADEFFWQYMIDSWIDRSDEQVVLGRDHWVR